MVRSVFAVAAGFFASAVLSTAGDLVLRAARPQVFDPHGRTQDPATLLVMLGYLALFSVAGGYIAATIAERRPMAHALVVGLISFGGNVIVSFATWNAAPAWYHTTVLLAVVPMALLGGSLRQLQVGHRAGA